VSSCSSLSAELTHQDWLWSEELSQRWSACLQRPRDEIVVACADDLRFEKIAGGDF
jgi:hypothetical protein